MPGFFYSVEYFYQVIPKNEGGFFVLYLEKLPERTTKLMIATQLSPSPHELIFLRTTWSAGGTLGNKRKLEKMVPAYPPMVKTSNAERHVLMRLSSHPSSLVVTSPMRRAVKGTIRKSLNARIANACQSATNTSGRVICTSVKKNTINKRKEPWAAFKQSLMCCIRKF